jgi:hypothetical protein
MTNPESSAPPGTKFVDRTINSFVIRDLDGFERANDTLIKRFRRPKEVVEKVNEVLLKSASKPPETDD